MVNLAILMLALLGGRYGMSFQQSRRVWWLSGGGSIPHVTALTGS
jgi:hypothetical protein